MLIGLPPILGADLLHALRAMGHGDDIVIADASFPAASLARRLIPMEAADLVATLSAVLRVLPIDEDEPVPVAGMEVIGHPTQTMPAHERISEVLASRSRAPGLLLLERSVFYERAKSAFAIVATGETMVYANVILRKGVVDVTASNGGAS